MYIMKEMFNKLKSKLFFKTQSQAKPPINAEELSILFETAIKTAPSEEISNQLNKKYKQFKENDRIAESE